MHFFLFLLTHYSRLLGDNNKKTESRVLRPSRRRDPPRFKVRVNSLANQSIFISPLLSDFKKVKIKLGPLPWQVLLPPNPGLAIVCLFVRSCSAHNSARPRSFHAFGRIWVAWDRTVGRYRVQMRSNFGTFTPNILPVISEYLCCMVWNVFF